MTARRIMAPIQQDRDWGAPACAFGATWVLPMNAAPTGSILSSAWSRMLAPILALALALALILAPILAALLFAPSVVFASDDLTESTSPTPNGLTSPPPNPTGDPAAPPLQAAPASAPIPLQEGRQTPEVGDHLHIHIPSDAQGQPLAHVELECDFPKCDEPGFHRALISLTDLRPGTPLTAESLEAAVHNLDKSGFFEGITTAISLTESGVSLTFQCEGATFIRDVVIQGNYPILEQEVRKRLFYRVGRRLDESPDTLRRQEESVQRIFQQEGYFESQVRILFEPMAPKQARVRVTINKGAQYRLGYVHVRGAKHYSPYRVARMFTGFLNLGSFTPGAVRKGRDELILAYQREGYFEARVRTRYEQGKAPQSVDIYVDIDEGTRYEVLFNGNRAVEDHLLMEVLTFWDTRDAGEHEVRRSVEAIRAHYQEAGYYGCRVTPVETELRRGMRRILFDIDEGVKARIDRIIFQGNRHLSDERLKQEMVSREAGFITPDGYLLPWVLEDDLRALAAFYRDEGFYRVRIAEPKVESLEGGRKLMVHVRIEEGIQTEIDRITLHNYALFTNRQMMRMIGVGPGSAYSSRRFNDGLGRIQAQYRQAGYPYTRLQVTCSVPPDNEEVACDMDQVVARRIDIHVEVDERIQVSAGEVLVKGNFVTEDRVIERAIPLKEEDPFDFHLLLRGQTKLRRFGLFQSVNTTLIGFSESERREKVGMVVHVEEPKYRFLEFAAGAQTVTVQESQQENVLSLAYWTDARYLDRNLFGWGKETSFNLMAGTLESKLAAGYRDPQFTGRDLNLLVQLHALLKNDLTERGQVYVDPRLFFQAAKIQDNFNHFELAGSVTLLKELRRGLMGRIQYRLEEVRRRTPDDESVFEGTPLLLSHLIPGATLDFRDNPLHPTKGFYLWGELDFSSSFLDTRSNSQFLRIMADIQGYYPLLRRRLVVATSFRLRWAIPFGDSEVGFENRFFVGGDGSVRGFPSKSIGPKDDDSYLGDNVALIFNQELRFPIQWGLWGALFYDAGTLVHTFGSLSLPETRHSTGFGLRYLIAGQIPLRVDVAFVLDPRTGEDIWGWNAALGYAF